jgi:hypothetical protein
LSSDLLERALFTFGRAASSNFNNKLSQGKARLNFARPENRELWLAGYQYIRSLIMKGTYGTALEWAKLLLTLQPEKDPYCMRLMIHHLALRAHEFKWLLDLNDSEWVDNFKTLPNDRSPAIHHFSPSLALAALQLRDSTKCRELLSDSMNKVPWLFFRLFKELDLDAPPSIWGVEPRTESETLFTEIYVLQTKDLWNTPEATALLMEIAHTIPKVDLSKLPPVDNSQMTLDVVRFVYLDGRPALMAMAPSELLHRSNNSDADPLPPDHNIFSYDAQRAQIEGQPRGMGGDYNNPLAAIGQFIPVIPMLRNLFGPRQAGENDEEFHARAEREMGDLHDRFGPEVGEAPPPGFLHRLLTSMYGGRGDDYDDDDDESSERTDTDEGMPGLEPLEEWEDEEDYFSDEMPPSEEDAGTDDEMPPFVPNS